MGHLTKDTLTLKKTAFLWGIVSLLLCGSLQVWGEDKSSPQTVGVHEKLRQFVSLPDLYFYNEDHERVQLARYFVKPVLLTLVYYECPNLCHLVLNGLLEGLKSLDWDIGKDFQVVTVSIHPGEGPALAKQKKANYLKSYGRSPASEEGWHFLSGSEDQIRRLASEVGFDYSYDAASQQYIHGAAIFFLSPQGQLMRSLHGVTFSSRDLRWALMEASHGDLGSVWDHFLFYFYRYDTQRRQYRVTMERVVCWGTVWLLCMLLGSAYYLYRPKKTQ